MAGDDGQHVSRQGAMDRTTFGQWICRPVVNPVSTVESAVNRLVAMRVAVQPAGNEQAIQPFKLGHFP